MRFFGKQKQKDELCLVFDIGSSSVGGAMFSMLPDGVPKIIYAVREPIPIAENINGDMLLTLTLKALKIVATKIALKGQGAPTKTFCVLGSPWYASQTRVISLEKNASFVFTQALADSLIQKEVMLFEEEHGIQAGGVNTVRTIEVKTMKTVLNGYATDNPFGKKAKEIEMTVFISTGEENVLKKIEEAVNRHFTSARIVFSTFVMASFAVGRDIFVNQDNFLLVNIGGELTEISMIKKDILCESSSFPLGRNFIVRGVSSELALSLDEAKSIISLYNNDHIDKSYGKNVDEVILKLKKEWLKSFQAVLSNLSKDISIPATVFITVGEDLAGFFADTIRTEQFNQYTLTESKFRVLFLGNQALHGIALFEDDTMRDSFLIIESIYINRFLL